MSYKSSPRKRAHCATLQDAADLLQALESLREEIGSVADDIIHVLRDAGVTPAQAPTPIPKPH